jgi:peptidoglycan glycosyltransferase
MNTPLRRVALAVMGMIVLLLANATYIQVIKADDYRSDQRNSRVLLEEYARQRGQIIAGGAPVAQSAEVSDSRLRFLRKYPKGEIYAPVTGFYSVLYGAGGLEKTEDGVLNGSDDRLFFNGLSDLITGRDTRGGNVVTTIDPRAQEAAFQGMSDRNFRGSVVAIRPRTGEILAMVSTPSYDPNQLASHAAPAQRDAWNAFNSGDRPLTNRATRETYPPGSTFKLVVTAAALSSGEMDENTQLPAAPVITLPGTNVDLENFNGNPCGGGQTVPLKEALPRSCNTAFAELTRMVGENRLRKQAEKFGIGQQDLTVPLPVAASSIGDIDGDPALMQSGIGQRDVRLTPLQNAVIAATIANGGERMAPHLVKELQEPDFSKLDSIDPDRVERAIDSRVATKIREMMIASEARTKGGGKIEGLTIASKTGTAEHGEDPKANPPHGWYVAFAPAEDPQIAVAVVVEEGGDRGLEATGGSLAAPIGRAVIAATLGRQ